MCNIPELSTILFNCALDKVFPALCKNSSVVHSRVGVIRGGLSGAGVNSMVKLVLEPRLSNSPFGFVRVESLRSAVVEDL